MFIKKNDYFIEKHFIFIKLNKYLFGVKGHNQTTEKSILKIKHIHLIGEVENGEMITEVIEIL